MRGHPAGSRASAVRGGLGVLAIGSAAAGSVPFSAGAQVPPRAADRGRTRAAGRDADVRFVLDDVQLAGGMVCSDETMRELFAPRLGMEQDLASAFAVAAEVQARCRNDGYLVTRVRVPAQRIEGGAVRLEIVEAVIGPVAIEEPVEAAGGADRAAAAGPAQPDAGPDRAGSAADQRHPRHHPRSRRAQAGGRRAWRHRPSCERGAGGAGGPLDLVADDRVHVAFPAVEGVRRDPCGACGAFQCRLGLRRWRDVFNASRAGDDQLSRQDGDGEFRSVRAERERTVPLPHGFGIWAKGWGQAADRPPLSSEKFSAGGSELGRGFHPSEGSRDMGDGRLG